MISCNSMPYNSLKSQLIKLFSIVYSSAHAIPAFPFLNEYSFIFQANTSLRSSKAVSFIISRLSI